MELRITPTYKVELVGGGRKGTFQFESSTLIFQTKGNTPTMPKSSIASEGAPCFTGANGIQGASLDPQWVELGIDMVSQLRGRLTGILFSKE